MANTFQRPGTVSQILWHFTGGPKWNTRRAKQNKYPKPAGEAFSALLGILTTRQLRLGGYKEYVRVDVPGLEFDSASADGLRRTKELRAYHLESAAVCCLADIPLMHLSYHAARYGKFAIGFHREAAIKAGFNAVLYTLHHTQLLQSLYEGFGQLDLIDTDYLREASAEITATTDPDDVDVWAALDTVKDAVVDIDEKVAAARLSVARLLAFIKTFGPQEFGTIYCEREWRCTEPFAFKFEDVAMIVMPRQIAGKTYFDRFVSHDVRHIDLPRSIPVVPWEDLVES